MGYRASRRLAPVAYRTPRIELQLEPLVIRSIIEDSGMDHAAIAKKLRVDRPRVDGWARTGRIEYSKVKALARCVKMSENLILSTVPPERESLPDYRMMRSAPEKLDAADRPTIRRVRYMLSAAEEMMGDLGIPAGPDVPAGVGVDMPAEEVARAERARLAVAGRPGGPVGAPSREIYGMLREAIERLNIFVFQYPLYTEGACGLSMTGATPSAILVNSRDTAQARAFALLHEYGHVLLGAGGICDEHGAARPGSEKGRTEAWCNRFAASFLMPEAEFAAERGRLEERSDDPFGIVGGLAKRFKVSRYAAAVRAAGLPGGRLDAAYGGVLDGAAGRHSRRQKAGGGGNTGGGNTRGGGPHCLAVLASRMGKKFIGLAVSSHKRGDITALDLGNYLDIDLKHLGGLCRKAGISE